MSKLKIVTLDFLERVLETSDGRLLPIANLFDAHGRETRDHRSAVLCIAGTPGNWLSVRLKGYRRSSLH